ncbi:MAG: L-fuculose-phosphate aldolase [Deltaproteobacteria bacterium]|jgi:L-fuculose-phosphate aldolase|nr:L-fuculose-phosphate aldolase [Deltaproteobacteria bacterium]MCW8892722.1 L-fuculose-phosphate aldolase [Deltaproteobacteria bacterium]MCW9049086.1 L-fuculose-phosphate aldolase [Deltaproteobacteria bacterium]
MKLLQQRQQLVTYGLKMVQSRLTTGSGGNLSILSPEDNLIAISPSGINYDQVTVEDIVVVDRNGKTVEGSRKPSSELGFHLALYAARPEIRSVVHTHSVYATTIACLHWEIPAVHYLVAFSGNKVPLAAYATFGTDELADNVVAGIGGYNAVLLANHGLVTVGKDIKYAFDTAEEIELVARIYYQSKSVGQPVLVNDEEMELVTAKFVSYGQLDTSVSN